MTSLLLTLLHLAVMTAKLCGHGGLRAVIAENLLLKQQQLGTKEADWQRAVSIVTKFFTLSKALK